MAISIQDLQKNRTLKPEEVKSIDKVIEATGAEDKPYPVTDNAGNTSIIGNVNKVVREPQNYKIMVAVDKATSPYTEEELKAINVADKLYQTETEYRVHLEVPITEITPEKRELANSAMSLIMQLFYREIEDDNGESHFEYITNSLERQARELEILSNPYISKMLKESVYNLLELPNPLRNTWVGEAVEVFVNFATNNPDVVNEVDANLD